MPIEAWLMDSSDADQREEHRREPNVPVPLEELAKLGVRHWHLDADNYETDPELQKIREENGYTYHDIVDIHKDRMPGYEDKLKIFFMEHIHDDDEIRYVLDGSGYFDVRNKDDEWIRISMDKGDLITLPAGISHRFTLDSKNYIKAMRLFIGDPVWTPHNRPCPDRKARQEYVEKFLDGADPFEPEAAKRPRLTEERKDDEAAAGGGKSDA